MASKGQRPASPAPLEGAIPTGTLAGGRLASGALWSACYRLAVEGGATPGQLFELGDGETRLGKGPENDIVIDHPTVSRLHLSISREGERYLLRDLGSTNGTFLDGSQVREAYLRAVALIEAGDVMLRFVPDQVPVQIAPSESHAFGGLVGESLRMRELFALLERVAQTEASLVIQGETGTGKGTVAAALHEHSPRASGPFVVFDCASVSRSLIESELFGHERGAFTGAVGQHKGFLEQASGGTLFIDQIEDLTLELQPKLLRALEEKSFRRVGGAGTLHFDARVIAASRKDLRAEVAAATFREDLYFRLSVFVLGLPPLRDRREDIPCLVDAFAHRAAWEGYTPAVKRLFQGHDWPGNLRELRNAVERAQHLAQLPGGLTADALFGGSDPSVSARRPAEPPSSFKPEPPSGASAQGGAADALPAFYDGTFKDTKDRLVSAFEREYLVRLLARSGGNIARAAREADLDRKYLYSLLKKYDLS